MRHPTRRPWTTRRDRVQAVLVWTAALVMLAGGGVALLLIPGGGTLDAP